MKNKTETEEKQATGKISVISNRSCNKSATNKQALSARKRQPSVKTTTGVVDQISQYVRVSATQRTIVSAAFTPQPLMSPADGSLLGGLRKRSRSALVERAGKWRCYVRVASFRVTTFYCSLARQRKSILNYVRGWLLVESAVMVTQCSTEPTRFPG